MRCRACGFDNRAGVRFCEECGVGLEQPCPACGEGGPAGRKFCGACGHQLEATTGPEPQPASAASYTPKHLAEKILASRAALEGERKQVTVLFADIKGSTDLIQGLDPEDAQRLLDGAVKAMMDAVHRYEGTVSRALGDGIMALFGAPIAHEDHAIRACYAALAMQDGMRRYAGDVRRLHGVEVEVRVGLNSGEVVVRLVSDDLHMDYTALGQTVHLASRIEQAAAAGSIRLTAGTLALVEGYVQVRSVGPIRVKGLPQPVDVYELVGTGAVRTRLQASTLRGLTRFVGRQAELDAVHTALERAKASHGQVVALTGEPGVGKSRLVWEVTHSPQAQDWTILEAGSVSYGKTTPYLPVISLLRSYCRIEPSDDPEAIRDRITSRLLSLGEELRPTLPAFLALLDVPVEDAAWDALDPPQRRQRTLDGVKHLLLRESREQPLLLVIEDLHWIDEGTQALLDSLIESLPTARLLLLVTYRPEYRHDWGTKTYYSQVRIDRLSPESAEGLLHSLLGDDATLEPLKQHLIERTEGNPFFLEESVRTLVETGALAGERGAYRLTQAVPSIRVPATVQAVLASRIDRLPPEDKRLLQSAAVVGKDVPVAVLQAIADLSEDELPRGLAQLQMAEFLYEVSLFPEPEYTFKHALTHEVAYGSLLQERRRALHARIVDAIEAIAGDRLAERVELLAHHAVRGEVWTKALGYLHQAGARAMGRSAHREASAYLHQALVAIEHLPESRDTLEQAVDIRFELRTALWPSGDLRQIAAHLAEAEDLAEALGDRRRSGYAALFMCTSLYGDAQHERAITAGRRAVASAEKLQDRRFLILAKVYLAQAHVARSDYLRTIELSSAAVAELVGELTHEHLGQVVLPSVLARVNLARAQADLGRFREGVEHGEESVRIADAVNHPASLTLACWAAGLPHLGGGNLPRAIPPLERALRIVQEADLPIFHHWVGPSLGSAYALAGRVEEAVSLLERAVDQDIALPIMSQHSLTLAYLGEAYHLAGRAEDAGTLAHRALSLSRTQDERGHQAWALRLLGEITSRHDPPDVEQAEDHYRQALALAEELGMRPLQAHCHFGLGKLYRKVGRMEEARVELATAVEMFRSMEMTHWLPQAEAELAEAATPLPSP